MRAFELLVIKYLRMLGRLLSRCVRDPAEVEDVAQEAFIKAYRALPTFRGDSAFYTWHYRIEINTAKNYLVAMGRRAPTTTGVDIDEAENFEEAARLRDQVRAIQTALVRQVVVLPTTRDTDVVGVARSGDCGTFAGLRFEGVTGTFTFDAQHDPLKSAVIMQIKNGQRSYADTGQP